MGGSHLRKRLEQRWPVWGRVECFGGEAAGRDGEADSEVVDASYREPSGAGLFVTVGCLVAGEHRRVETRLGTGSSGGVGQCGIPVGGELAGRCVTTPRALGAGTTPMR
ncbi:hypothetical protein SAMN05216266_1177 [Amycolatopsis marina]|uniref:Uncharacterized protein n=1 Tax=Amycolatopsis marina TaxID=490629 RepID=A0A1I1BS69_9PSEU|nr:hypothetical protein [Amycolatopsis marina]SFB53269.1 hypothetical protein SAMN05216266_1177 [Amycolatopsis marina]